MNSHTRVASRATSVQHSGRAHSSLAIIVPAVILGIFLVTILFLCCTIYAWVRQRGAGAPHGSIAESAGSPKLVAKVADFEDEDEDGSAHTAWWVRSAAFESNSASPKVQCLQSHM
jgi:hypothetical protein